jgi:hypothetical protein
MKLDNCVLEITHVVARPPSLTAPEREWIDARDRGTIPNNLYHFYCLTDYFSFDRAPRFLNDPDRLLFSFLGALAWGILESLGEAHALVDSIRSDQGKGYTPVKRIQGEEYDAEALTRQRRSFRYLIVNLFAALDQLAEVVSIFFHGDIKDLTVGRASFTVLRGLARSPFAPVGVIVSPKEARFQDIHTVLVEELEASGEEEQWFELLHLYRNKLAHLGTPMFPVMAFPDGDGEFYSFTPRRWPLFHQSELRRTGEVPAEPKAIEAYVKLNYVHQDVVSYSHGALSRVQRLIDRMFHVLNGTYIEFKEFDLNGSALRSLKDKKEHSSFRAFDESGSA